MGEGCPAKILNPRRTSLLERKVIGSEREKEERMREKTT
jgi:hypothetical protein